MKLVNGTMMMALVLAAAGCGTAIQYTELNSPPGAMRPRDAASVEVFTTALSSRPFVEVGMIESQQESGWSTDGMGEIVQAMREHAGERGCDALVIRGANDAVVVHASQGHGSIGTLKGYKGTCIVYTGAAAPGAAAAPAAEAAAPAPPADGAPAAAPAGEGPAAPGATDAAAKAAPAPAAPAAPAP